MKKLRDDQKSLDSVLEQINSYRMDGHWHDDKDNGLREDFEILQASMPHSTASTSQPTFEVTVIEDSVNVNVIPTIGDYLRYRKGFGQYSIAAKKFIQRMKDRTLFLNYLADQVLENVQVDFFRQNDLNSALLHLLPLQAKEISDLDLKDLNLNFSFKLDKKLISKMCDLTVKCDFRIFPFGFFLPSKLVLVRRWVKHANDNGITTIKGQCEWIKEQLYERLNKWDYKDPRCCRIKSLLDTNESDIKNARKAVLKKQLAKRI
jgi:hypothetical protein